MNSATNSPYCTKCRGCVPLLRSSVGTPKPVCRGCYNRSTCPYTLVEHTRCDSPCGGITVYKVAPAATRLRTLVHYEQVLRNLRKRSDFSRVQQWEQIWAVTAGWDDELGFDRAHVGPVKRGLMATDSNGIIAYVEDHTGLWYIHGVWG